MKFYHRLLKSAHRPHRNSLILLEIIGGLFLSILSFVVFLNITKKVLEKDGINIDNTVSNFVYSLRTPVMTSIMKAISFLGGEFIIAASAIIVVFLVWKRLNKEAQLFSFIILIGYILTGSLKYILKIPRPNIDPVYILKSYSFPSGHAMNSFIFYSFLSYLMFHFTGNKKISLLFSIVAMTLVFLIGVSRVYLGVHFPTDVIAGFLAGFWWFITAVLIHKTLTFRSARQKG